MWTIISKIELSSRTKTGYGSHAIAHGLLGGNGSHRLSNDAYCLTNALDFRVWVNWLKSSQTLPEHQYHICVIFWSIQAQSWQNYTIKQWHNIKKTEKRNPSKLLVSIHSGFN